MLSKILITAVSASFLSVSVAEAQSLRQMGGPRNLPPAGFTGQQFVDSDGCVFLKAGFGGQTNWVPRIKANRRPLCGFPPTFGAQVAAAVEADMAPAEGPAPDAVAPIIATAPVSAPAAQTVAPPVAMAPVIAAPAIAPPVLAAPLTVAVPMVTPPLAVQPVAPTYTTPRRSLFSLLFGKPAVGNPIPLVPVAPASNVAVAPALPVVAARPSYATAPLTGAAQCVAGSPVLETVVLRSGGTALVCTRGDGTLTGWRSPLFPQGAVGAALTPQLMRGATLQHPGGARYVNVQTATSTAIPTPPRGYKLAWEDDRLNPRRGQGTATGQAQQDQVWTRTVPAVQVAAAPVAAAQPQVRQARVAVSTMSAPASEPTTAAAFVQVGTFGQPANADGVRARLTALGLPVSTSKITRKGKILQIVFAGPFGTKAEAQAALNATHNAGYGDAILK